MASKESTLGKVFQNNMDKYSIGSDVKKQIEFIISNSKTALYYDAGTIKAFQEYKNCQVRKCFHFLVY